MSTIKKAVIITFASIVFLPVVLGMIGNFCERKHDVELKGYTDNVEKPSLTADTFFSGNFQSAWNTLL